MPNTKVDMYVPVFWRSSNGIAQASLGIASQLSLKCDLTVHTYREDHTSKVTFSQSNSVESNRFRVIYHSFFFIPKFGFFSPSILSAILRSDARIIHIQGMAMPLEGFLIQKIVKRLNRKKILLTAHTLQEGIQTLGRMPLSSVMQQCFCTLYLKSFDGIIVLTNEGKKLLEDIGYDAKKISVIPNAVYTAKFRKRSVWHVLPLKSKPLTILYVAPFNWNKGHEFLLEAIYNLRLKHSFVCFFVGSVGDERYLIKINKLIQQKQLSDIVFIKNYVSDEELTTFYESSDIFVFPSVSESFGIAVLEAMYFGLPVISSAVGALPEIIRDDWNGYLVQPCNSAQLEVAIDLLVSNPSKRAMFAENGKKMATRYSWRNVAEQTLSLYQKIAPLN